MADGGVDVKLHGRTVHTVFDLLGEKEDDITYSVGWGLAGSKHFAYALLAEAFEGDVGELSAVLLQQTETGFGRTDIELQTQDVHLIVEAKRGWDLPGLDQLTTYARRLNRGDARQRAIAVVSECARDYPPVQALPPEVEGVPIHYIPWSRVAGLVSAATDGTNNRAEKRLLDELDRYLRRLMTSRDVTSNIVYVVSLNDHDLRWSDLTFVQTVMERDRYYHPVGGTGKKSTWPKTPANYLGFRFDGQLQRVSFVESYEVVTRPHDHIPEISPDADWTEEPHFLYALGPALPLPEHAVKSTGMWTRHARVAFDLLLTSPTIREAELKTQERLARAGEEE